MKRFLAQLKRSQIIQKEDNKDFSSYSMSELNDMLQEAIKNEEYEKASDIRDILKKKQH